ncbi:NtaA/DmoA family FMN-dependent monooxygenase [Lysinibacter sp. HNR]|uniref:NtaA/DmoA family FMN-dependent monooxygenase n=1 Tax=Lysinibacter sp. HNR TaxID=3031408 RepID=UPI002434C63A|nr:NtaA/DmoA family FMN-dependent monooxygenase [Lysinibacter sp. HNR]WGD37104.1 NtaA/DmoA family FMN-dependent monooxygenase [Lysinibacter sp. HNR]
MSVTSASSVPASPVSASRQKNRRHQIQLGAFFQGVNFSTIWNSPESGSQTDFESFRRIAQTAERGLFAAFFLGEGLRLREHLGHLHELDVAGRPDAAIQLAALAAVTERIGLVATQNTTYHEPTAIAHRLGSLDFLSGGRAAWNIVTTDNAWTGENFRRGGYLDHADRYTHAEFVVNTVRALWDSYERDGAAAVSTSDAYSRVDAVSRVPRSPQQHPVLFQAGDSAEGRDFAARNADVIFSAHSLFERASEFSADIRRRTLKAGRPADDLKIFPAQEFILADTDAEAQDKARWVRESQITPQTAIAFVEQTWGRDLSEYDPDGPLPDIPTAQEQSNETRGTGFHGHRAAETVAGWRALSEEKNLSIRELVIHLNSGTGFVGSYSSVANQLERFSDAGVVDGFNVTPYLIPAGIDDIVNGLVPELQERGIYPAEYAGETLRENLGLRPPLNRREG